MNCGTNTGGNGKCCCPCHKMAGVLVILFGLTFLLGALNVIGQNVVNIVWPILVMLGGLKCLCAGKCKCCDKA